MAYTVLFGVFTLLMMIGMPIAFCLGIASLATVLYIGIPPIVVFQQMNSGMNVFAMMAIPFFIFAGDLMVRGGIANRLIRFAAGIVGHLRGGLGQVNIVASTLFGGISGSAVADASAVGGLMIPQMAARGYDRSYAVNVTVNAAIIALMIGYSAFIAEIFRAGIQSIDKGQIEAAKALGLSRGQRFRLVVFPQAIRVIFPPLSNDFVAMVKDSSLVSVLGVADITQMGKVYASGSFRFFETYSIVAYVYLVLTIGLSLMLRGFEKRMRSRAER